MAVFISVKSAHSAKYKGALEPVLALQQDESGLGLRFQLMLNLFTETTTCVNGHRGLTGSVSQGHEPSE